MESVVVQIKQMESTSLAYIKFNGRDIGILFINETPLPSREQILLARGKVVEADIVWKGME